MLSRTPWNVGRLPKIKLSPKHYSLHCFVWVVISGNVSDVWLRIFGSSVDTEGYSSSEWGYVTSKGSKLQQLGISWEVHTLPSRKLTWLLCPIWSLEQRKIQRKTGSFVNCFLLNHRLLWEYNSTRDIEIRNYWRIHQPSLKIFL
jgi:hypothetical protein